MAHDEKLRLGQLKVEKHLSGGVLLSLGRDCCVLRPDEAIKFAVGVLTAAGCDANIVHPALHKPALVVGRPL